MKILSAKWGRPSIIDLDSMHEEDYSSIYNRFQKQFTFIFCNLFIYDFIYDEIEEFIKLKYELRNTDRFRKLVYAPSGKYHFINKIYDDIFQLFINWLFTYLGISTSKIPIFESNYHSNYQKGLNLEKYCLAILKEKNFSAKLTNPLVIMAWI